MRRLLRPFALAPALLVAGLVLGMLSGCDTGGSPGAYARLDGDYRFTRFAFDSQNTTFGTLDLLAYLDSTGTPPVPEVALDLFGQSSTYAFVYRLRADGARSSVTGDYDPIGRDGVTIDFGANAATARRLLLPASVRFTVTGDGATLTADFPQTVSFADLAVLDPDRFRNISGTLTGRLQITAVRR